MDAHFNHLLANCAIILFGILAWTNLPKRWSLLEKQAPLQIGIVFGTCTLAVMSHPLETAEGVFIDLRTIPLSIAGLAGGWPAALIAGSVAGIFRIVSGGAGMIAGLSVIFFAACLGAISQIMTGARIPTIRELLVFCTLLALGDLFVIQMMPQSLEIAAVQQHPLRWFAIVFITALLSSSAVFAELRRRADTSKLRMYEAALQALPEPLNVKDREGRFVLANAATAKLMGASSEAELVGRADCEFYPTEVATRLRVDEEQIIAARTAQLIDQRISFADDRDELILSTLKAPLLDQKGQLLGIITHNRDITENRRLMKALADSERQAQAALVNMADGLIMFDPDLNVIFCNEQYRAMFPLTRDLRTAGTPARAILEAAIARGELTGIPADQAKSFIDNAMARLRVPGTVEFPLYDGRWVESRTTPSADGSCLVVCSDITRSKKDALELRNLNEALVEMAMTDGLTGLLNRRAFDTSLTMELGRSSETNLSLSLLLIDVDHFKAFNDRYGHTAGDACLKEVASTVRTVTRRPGDRAARYGGEEMAVILPNTSNEAALELADDLRIRIRDLQISHLGSDKGVVTVSIGIATFDGGDLPVSAAELIDQADQALYRAKAAGRDLVCSGQGELQGRRKM